MATEIKLPKITLLDHVNNYFFEHKGQEIMARNLKELMLKLGRDPKQAPAQIYLLQRRGDAICVKKGTGTKPSFYMATEKIKFVTVSKTRKYKSKFSSLEDQKTPEGVLMLQNLFIPSLAPSIRIWDEA